MQVSDEKGNDHRIWHLIPLGCEAAGEVTRNGNQGISPRAVYLLFLNPKELFWGDDLVGKVL